MRPPTPQILDFGGGFWILGILDFGFWILGILDFGFWGFWILDFGFWGFWILDFGDFGFWIFGILGILDFGFLEDYVADFYVQSLDFGIWGFWILDFGDFGFWILGILDFGFWGSWILDFGLGILDGHLVTKFWMLHKKRRLCTPNRVGGLLDLICIWKTEEMCVLPPNQRKCMLQTQVRNYAFVTFAKSIPESGGKFIPSTGRKSSFPRHYTY